MIRDKSKKVRSVAYHRISKARREFENTASSSIVRQFVLPKIKFTVNNYYDLINWTKVQVTDPPLTMKYSLHDLRSLVDDGESLPLWKSENFRLPCHTQTVER